MNKQRLLACLSNVYLKEHHAASALARVPHPMFQLRHLISCWTTRERETTTRVLDIYGNLRKSLYLEFSKLEAHH